MTPNVSAPHAHGGAVQPAHSWPGRHASFLATVEACPSGPHTPPPQQHWPPPPPSHHHQQRGHAAPSAHSRQHSQPPQHPCYPPAAPRPQQRSLQHSVSVPPPPPAMGQPVEYGGWQPPPAAPVGGYVASGTPTYSPYGPPLVMSSSGYVGPAYVTPQGAYCRPPDHAAPRGAQRRDAGGGGGGGAGTGAAAGLAAGAICCGMGAIMHEVLGALFA